MAESCVFLSGGHPFYYLVVTRINHVPPRIKEILKNRQWGIQAMSRGPGPDRVLIVDDEPDILEALKDVIEGFLDGVEVITADSGPAALEYLRREPVDLIITDQKMPGMTGLQFLREAVGLQSHVPRIMVTAFPDLDLAIQALNEGHIINFLAKPVSSESVIQVVCAALEERRLELARQRTLATALHAMKEGAARA